MKELKQEEMLQVDGGAVPVVPAVYWIGGALTSMTLAQYATAGAKAVAGGDWSNAKLYGSSRMAATERI